MNTVVKSVVSVLAGMLAFVGVGVIEALAPHVWPAAMLGGPAGFVAGGGLAALLSTQAIGLATAMVFVGFPVGLLSAVVMGYLALRRSPVDRRPPGSIPQ